MEQEQVTIPGPPIGYIDLLDIAILNKLEKEAAERPSKNPLRPSSAGKCAREKAFEFMEYKGFAKYDKEPLTPDQSRIFSLGHSVEDHILKLFYQVEAFNVSYRQQVLTFQRLPDGSVQEGSIDVCFISDKWKCVADVKSKKDKYSSYYSSSWDELLDRLGTMNSVQRIGDSERAFWVEDLEAFLYELNDPFMRANFVQLNLYACNSFCTDRGINHGAILYYNKNDSRLIEVRFKPHKGLYDRVLETDATILSTVMETRDPLSIQREYNFGSIKCAFCSFKKQCWEGSEEAAHGDALKAYFRSLPDRKWPKDTERLGNAGTRLNQLCETLEEATRIKKEADREEQEALLILQELGIGKIRTDKGYVYEVKQYKSPKPHVRLIRSKV